MKKILLISATLLFSNFAVWANPNPDMSVGGMPFQLMRQQTFQKMEMQDYMRFKDANDMPVEMKSFFVSGLLEGLGISFVLSKLANDDDLTVSLGRVFLNDDESSPFSSSSNGETML